MGNCMPPKGYIKMSKPISSASENNLQGSEKLEDVKRLLKNLSEDLEKISLLPHQRDETLEKLKVYGRNPQNADPIFTKEGIEVLTRHALNSPSKITSRNALRCLANAMLLKPATRQMFVDLHYESKACTCLKHDNRDDEFLISRILFLTTYNTNIDIEALIDQHHLAEIITQNLARHAAHYDEKKKKKLQTDPMEEMALAETLKLFFNVSHFCPQRNQAFTPAIPHILIILGKRQVIPSKPLEAPFGPLINSLINLDLKNTDAKHELFPKMNPTFNTARFIELLDLAIRSYKEEELDQQVSPLLTLIRKVYEVGPTDVKSNMKMLILPSDSDRKQPLGRTETLPSKLLRLSTSPLAPQSREGISSLLFEMSERDARKFVQNVGYGFASGFLFQHNVPIPENAVDAFSTNDSDGGSSSGTNEKQINPITGQAVDFESKFDGPEMTQAEKEREAEKLMVLFDRLKRNGVITAENPVAKAQREGVFEDSRFTELDSDDDNA